MVTMKPFVHFTGSTITYTEGGTQPTVGIQVVGIVPASFNITLAVAGTATGGGGDYTLTNATIPIPAGDYGLGRVFNAPLSLVDDAVIENNKTLVLTIPASTSASPYVLAHTTACGTAPNNQLTVNIIDNDIDLLTTKTSSTAAPLYIASPPAAAPYTYTYTVTYRNNTAATTGASTTAHNVTAAISDPVPAGVIFNSWTCTPSGTAGTACPGAIGSGSGAISGNAVLPAGGILTYVITSTLAGPTCAAITNVSTITTPAGFGEGTSVQPGYTSPAPGGTENNTANVSVTPQCTDLRISKSNTSIPTDRLDGDTDTVTSGLPTTYTLFVENAGPAVNGAVIKDTVGIGLTCPTTATVTCSGSNPSICPSATYTVANLTGTGITLGNFPANATATLTFTCTVN